MKVQKLHFAPEKETPGTVRYKECTPKGTPKPADKRVSGTLYVSKNVVGTDPAEWPTMLVVTITSADSDDEE